MVVIGAGATRGAQFVNEGASPQCLPPLNADFFTQLQRITAAKHDGDVANVLADVLDLYGPNYTLTLEEYFTQLEALIAMIEASSSSTAKFSGRRSAPSGSTNPTRATATASGTSAPLIPEAQRFSRIYRGRMELIDHIFVSHYLVPGTRTTDVTTIAAAPGIPSIEDNPDEQKGRLGSDHAAVVATFDF